MVAIHLVMLTFVTSLITLQLFSSHIRCSVSGLYQTSTDTECWPSASPVTEPWDNLVFCTICLCLSNGSI